LRGRSTPPPDAAMSRADVEPMHTHRTPDMALWDQ
jgi:hypothetical protein